MNRLFTVTTALSVALVGGSLSEAIAVPTNSLSMQDDLLTQQDSIGQVNSVFQLRDVAPSDWAFDALRNLVEKYNCIVGYPDGTFRGNRSLSRYEFAAGLNACMQQIERLIVGGGTDVDAADITRLRALVQEFEAELATLGARVDDIEGRVEFLEDHQFSTTTKLEGKVIFAAIGSGGGAGDDDQITFGNRVRLNLDTSFTGEDNLRVRLQAENANSPDIGTPEGNLAFAGGGTNDVVVDALVYAFPLGEKLNVAIAANAGASDDFASTINYLDGDGNEGALSTFGTRNPIYYLIEDKGIGFDYAFSDKINLGVGYMAPDAQDPSEGNGLFNGAYGAMAQLHVKPVDSFEFGLTYLNSYNISDTGTGSSRSNISEFITDNGGTATTTTNSFGIEASWMLSERFVLGGWVGYSDVSLESSAGLTGDEAEIWNWAATLAFPDLGKDGALGGLIVGMEPRVTDSNITVGGLSAEDSDTSLHIEGFYQYPINDNISIMPGFVWLTSPDHNDSNDSVVIGTIRTLFSF
ncbi:cyanobacterial porin [[Leptolyngbya] sp. PCC 7376]|uniref:iron uptake porin n=1 Tax=[Leptolyngbya] sp. PCC 7376 TaxID=111781 RepID=UPI00029F03A1|nr:iron uptake porin [[Leptolyngbya] sp. PCC 7376]AFY38760.1 cyanobacterial porin [[Leptolyngbya] sp. PCC 7376]